MAVVAPMAKWKPLTRPMSTTPLTHNIICLHTMVGTLEGSWSWSNREGGSSWHFGVGGDGELWQCQDLRYRSAANLEGNWRCIPIETEDTNAGFFPRPYANPLWTPAQINKLAQLIAWLCVRYNIPCRLVPNSRPEHRGIAYHKQGCEPNVVAGGENWSSSFGKTCPNARISQVPEVIAKANAIINPKDWFDMATKAELDAVIKANVDNIAAAVWARLIDIDDPNTPEGKHRAWVVLRDARNLAGKAVVNTTAASPPPPS